MLTEEQKSKALLALLPSIDDLEKHRALERHNKACTGMQLYGLPYRVYLDYLKWFDTLTKTEKENVVMINPMYPRNGYPKERLLMITDEDIDFRDMDILNVTYENLKPETQSKVAKCIKDLREWELNSDTWRYNFLHFLSGYDFRTFTEFDFFGTQNEWNDETDISLLRKAYTGYKEDFESNPDNYLVNEPTTNKAEKGKYTDKPFIWLHDAKKKTDRENALMQLQNGCTLTDKEYLTIYGVDRNGDYEEYISSY